jgi:hypothetical protein
MSDALRSRIHDVRGPGIQKASASWEEVCKRRAQAMYLDAVRASGGYSATADSERCDESTVRDRCHDPRRIPALRHALAGLSREGLYELAKHLCDFADEMEGERRAG